MSTPNKTKGDFRPIYESLPDHPKFQALQPPARLLLLVLKTVLGAAGIRQVYTAVLSEQTGLSMEVVERAAKELEEVGWIRRQWRVWWIVDGLEHEPNISLKNEKHRIFAAKCVADLPRLQIVSDFLDHYGLPNEFCGPAPSDPIPPPKGYSNGYVMDYTEPNPNPNPISSSNEDSSKIEPISDLWEIWVEELGGRPPHPKLTKQRRVKIKALYEEQLRDLQDPRGVFRNILKAVRRSDHHMGNRAYQMPDSLFLNAERRDRWTQAAINGKALRAEGLKRPRHLLSA